MEDMLLAEDVGVGVVAEAVFDVVAVGVVTEDALDGWVTEAVLLDWDSVGVVIVSLSVSEATSVSVAVGSDTNDCVLVIENVPVAVQYPSSPQVEFSVQHSSVQHVSPSRQMPPSQQISESTI